MGKFCVGRLTPCKDQAKRSKDHLLFGPSYRVNVITTSELGINPDYYYQAIDDFNNEAGGILSSQGGDLLGETFYTTSGLELGHVADLHVA